MTDALFADLVDALLTVPGVTPPGPGRTFGAAALKIDNRIFAMLTGGALVLKLPAARVRALVEAGEGGPFDAGKGTPMREWVAIGADRAGAWEPLAREAAAFVGEAGR